MTAAVPARVNLITLGVTDRAASQRFYEKLGWQPKARAYEASITFLGLDNLALALWDRDKLAEDAKLPLTPPGFGGFTLAINLPDEKAVDAALDAAVAAGGRLLKPGTKADWGGYSGYFADPDGHPWEVAFNPFVPLDARGLMVLPD
ncbi:MULTISPECIES: VOC family protein [unclassified Chelatococcus]|uniref:VOC family protein n=1 Tax=unclassified Chelatococcus TaxID=2638111 RepID=UPI0002F9C154|nr:MULTISPECIES: VOC family protein [unclassified Chelatococcus]ALA18183.1 glyoxalase [Chelatococcus sp. CO-6]